MKTARVFILLAFTVAIISLVWQARTITRLRAEQAGLRTDLHTALESALASASGLPPEAAQTEREKLELIKLRHEVRQLNESLVDSHAREQTANLQALKRAFFPAPDVGGPWKFRPEWKGTLMEAQATNQYAQAMRTLAGATNDYSRFLSMHRAARMSLAVGRTEQARQLATDMLVLSDKYSGGDPAKANGDVVHVGHVVLGTIAVDEGRIDEGKGHLLAAGRSNGSPTLNSFGPNMSFASDLLKKGEQESVLKYLELCRVFWKSDGGKLDQWIKEIQAGRIPDFGGNLLY